MTIPTSLLACATCYGDPSSSLTQGMNMGILVMLGVTGLVLGGCGALFVMFARRAHRTALPPVTEENQ